MIQTPTKTVTLKEFLQLPETKPAREYVDGKILQKPMPQGKHSIIQGEIVTTINAIVKPQRIARAFPELRCTFGGRSIVPDVAIFAWSRIPRDENGEVANAFLIAPDWIIEILSPDQNQMKVTKNILHSLKHGTMVGWLIDPFDRSILVYFIDRPTEIFSASDSLLPVPSFVSEIKLTIRDIFAWLTE